MPRVAATINNAKQLDRVIDDVLAQGITGNVRKTVGGGKSPGGLMIQINEVGSASWILRIQYAGQRREFGLGSYRRANARSGEPPEVSLSRARQLADDMRSAIVAGRDPRSALRQNQSNEVKTFEALAREYIAKERGAWKNEKHAAQWTSTLKKWVYPLMGDTLPVGIDLQSVLSALTQPVDPANGDTTPLWVARHTTAKRVRQRIEAVLEYAIALGLRPDTNPARIPGPLSKVLPALSKQQKKVRSHASLSYAEMPAFMALLKERTGVAAQALQFAILTAARSGEVRGADWSEIDLRARLWSIPGERMKVGEPHVVPLSEPAVAILETIPKPRRKGLIFPAVRSRKELSDMAPAMVLRRMGFAHVTVHGFRSSFRTWAEERTSFSHEVKEMALAHQVGSDVERAYRRTDMLEQRTVLMNQWGEFLTQSVAENGN